MSFGISGYVLEPIRVGQSNSPFTQTPDNYVANQVAFDAAYPADESNPRTEYLVVVTAEGTSHPGFLVSARFGWTKNEVVSRFGYAAQAGRFKPLPGAAVTVVGTLVTDSNTTRLKVRPPTQAAVLVDAPYRLAVGTTGSGTTWTVTIVATDGGFGLPPPGTAELSLETGNLNWNTADLTTFAGQLVRFQQQQFFGYTESTGNVGFAPITLTDPIVILNPKPGPGQSPLLRFGFGFYLTTVQVANEGAFTVPPIGTVQWALTTGRLNFNPTDAANNAGIPVYYDGVLFATGLALPSQILGDIATPSAIVGLPPVGVDLIFSLPNETPYYQFPRFTYLPNTSFSSGKVGVVQVDPTTGDVQFSASDQATYAGESVTLTFGDLPIERGISIRFLRTPVNLDGSQDDLKDVTAIYTVEGAVWADPIIGSPQVFLPSTPIDATGFSITVKVLQGQGTFTSDNFPRLDVPSPPIGLGYFINFDAGTLFYAQRKNLEIIPIVQRTSDVVLPDPLVLSGNLLLELETGPGTGIYTPLVLGEDALFDSTSGAVTLIDNAGQIVAQGTGTFTGTTFTDTTANFITAGVQPGYLLEISNTAAKGVYTVSGVAATILATDVPTPTPVVGASYTVRTNREILADRFFDEVQLVDPSTKVERIRLLGTASNGPRLNVPVAYVDSSGFRFGSASANIFATVVIVPNNGAFTAPPAGTVQLSAASGDLNFAAVDLGTAVYWVRELTPDVDYTMSPGLGLLQFSDRMLELEEVRVTYTTEPPSTDPPTPPGSPVTEYAGFLIRKELTQPHPTPTSTLSFNVAGLPVASDPVPAVFRGGRPQRLGIQCTVDTGASTITFLADSQITDALPHGAIVGPTERVYIDYYVSQAVGGEKTVTALNPPIHTAVVNIQELDSGGNPNNQFTVNGDHTASFQADYLLRVENEQIYLIGSSVYAPGPDTTTVTLFGNQTFQDSFTAPTLYVSSGPTPITSAPLMPAYFSPEMAAYEAIARGSNTFLVVGDRTTSYRTGIITFFTDGGSTFTDFLQVAGASYDAATDRTTVMLTANALRQYMQGSQLLRYSVRPVFEPPTVEVRTSEVPVLTQPYVVYRRLSGEPGVILTSPTEYTIDDSGRVVFATPLALLEEFSIFYTGREVVSPGINLRASYTSQIVPDSSNGLAGQILTADYSILSPDSFFYRVETMTNFRGEYAQELESEASSGSSGPQTENASQPQLFEQGRTSLYFDEKHLANQDIIARSSLLFYNTSVNLLEAYLRSLDGRVVGLLLFDGTTGAVHPPGPVTNQIDDIIQVSPAPYSITFPPFAVTSIGTFRKYYLPGSKSRFYPTKKNFFAVSAVTPTSQTGDEVVDTKSTNVTAVSQLYTRLAWGVLTESTDFSGSSILKVDFADGTETGFAEQAETYARPPFTAGMRCVVQRRDGTFINDTASPITVTAVAPFQLTVTGLASTADVGTTVYRSPIDDSAQVDPDTLTYYLFGRDFFFNGDNGQIVYFAEFPPLSNTPLIPEQALSGTINLSNTLTAPLQFPALFGSIEDDDGDLSFPIQTPDPNSELNSYLFTEDKIIHDPTGLIRTYTTSPFVGTGSLNVPRTIITNLAGNFPAPVPKVHDLVRILNGLNGLTNFVPITAVTVSTVTVATPFAVQDTGFTFEVTVSALAVTGTADLTSTTTTLDDALATFLISVQVGQTVVATSGANTGQRRQIATIVSNTQLTVTPAFPAVLAGAGYRVDNSLATYGGTPNDYLADLNAALLGELALYPAEQVYILDFLNQVFTDIVTGATGQTTIGQPFLNDASATFLSSGVTSAHFVFILTGANAGFYQIDSVNSETQLAMTTNFPATLAGISYRVVKLFGVSPESVTALFALYQGIATLLSSATTFQALISTPVTVTGEPNFFARGTLTSDLDDRDDIVDARIVAIPTSIETVETILVNTDTLYDKRYTWIDARINLESGLIVEQAAATANRIKAQANILKQLIKLLAVEES